MCIRDSDMSGNVYEWCEDWSGGYSVTSQRDPLGAASGFFRVLRGGSWLDVAKNCRVSIRFGRTPGNLYLIHILESIILLLRAIR